MRTIWKYEVPFPSGDFTLEIPDPALFLDVQMQRGKPMLWAEVESEAPLLTRRFLLVGTGHEIPDDEEWWHLGTFQVEDGLYVFHLFYSP